MKSIASVVAAVAATLAFAPPVLARHNHHRVLLATAREDASYSNVTLPLYRGTCHGRTVWYVITDASTRQAAAALGVNYSPKLALAAGTDAVQHVRVGRHGLDFPGTVDFSPDREIEQGPYGPDETGLPLGVIHAGSVGDAAYSPLVELPDGTVLNASHVANATGHLDKAVRIRTLGAHPTATFAETTGFFEHHTVHYISLDASAEAAAVLENVTWAPRLGAAPGGDPLDENTDPATSSRAGIVAFTNGQTGLDNPQRQGLGSTILDGPSGVTTRPGPVPLNIVQALPDGLRATLYSPLWDAHLTRWNPASANPAAVQRLPQTDFEDVEQLAADGDVTNPAGGAWGRSGPVPNCPVISTDGDGEVVIP
jgi:hypothetical protein